MLNDRERRVLDRIEQHLRTSDPDFTRMFEAIAHGPSVTSTPRFLLVVGLLLLVLGTALVTVPVAVFGMLLSAVALLMSFQHNGRAGFSAA